MSWYALIPTLFGLGGLFVAWKIYELLLSNPEGEGKLKSIGDAIHSGAMVFMKREYRMLGIFAAVLLVLLLISGLGFGTVFSFFIGAAASATAGYLGMFSATKANVRTTVAAHEKGASDALQISFFGGSIMGPHLASWDWASFICSLAATQMQPTPSTASAWVPPQLHYSLVWVAVFLPSLRTLAPI